MSVGEQQADGPGSSPRTTTSTQLVVRTAWLIVVPQVVVVVPLGMLTIAMLGTWFVVYVPVLVVPGVVMVGSVQRASVRINEPWRGWGWTDLVLNLSLFLVGAGVWWWALSISLADIDSRQVFWLAVSAGWLLTVAAATCLVGLVLWRSRHDTGIRPDLPPPPPPPPPPF